MRTKIQRSRPVGELHPLPVPEARWDVISVDFVVELPQSNGHDAVMNVVDSVSKRVHFVPTTTTVSALGAARLYLHHVWRHHGLPRAVVSDRGPQFVAEFTKELYRLLGIKLSSSTAYHPQSDGQTERVNMELEQYLRVFVNERQDDWEDLLPLAEFQYNNHVHASTQHTPFMLDTGRHPRMGFEPRQQPSKLETVNEFRDRMEETLTEAKAALVKAKDDMAKTCLFLGVFVSSMYIMTPDTSLWSLCALCSPLYFSGGIPSNDDPLSPRILRSPRDLPFSQGGSESPPDPSPELMLLESESEDSSSLGNSSFSLESSSELLELESEGSLGGVALCLPFLEPVILFALFRTLAM
jgi:hypothetical protein